MKCHECNAEMRKVVGVYHYKESGLDNVFLSDVDLYSCECGEEFASIPAIIELNSVIAIFLVKKKTCLKGQEIKFLRKNAGLSAKAFAEYLGVNKSTLSRWENNKTDLDKSNDRMIRLFYATFKGIPSKEIKNFLDDVIKDIRHHGKDLKINIPIDAILSKRQLECDLCC